MSASDSADDVDELLKWRAVDRQMRGRFLASALGAVAVLVASILVWRTLGLGYGGLVAAVGVLALVDVGWLGFALLALVRWRGGRHDVLVSLAVVVSTWWLVRFVLSRLFGWVIRLYSEERSAGWTELRSVPEPVERAFDWFGPREDAPFTTSELLVALITTDPAARWGALGDLVLRPGGVAELEDDITAVPTKSGPVAVTAPTARALRLATLLGDSYELSLTAPLVALALVLEGPAAKQLIVGAGMSQAEALEVLQGDPLGSDLEDLEQAHAAFGVIEAEASGARAAPIEVEEEYKPLFPGLVNTVAVVLAFIVVVSAVGEAAGLPRVLRAGDQLESAVAERQADHTDAAIRGFTEVVQDYPDSIAALFGLSCSLWDLGYRDHALLSFAGMLAAGYRPQGEATGCFVTAPASVGIRTIRISKAVRPYVSDPKDSFDRELLELLSVAVKTSDSYWQAELVLACLNHRNGFRLVAGSNFRAAEFQFANERLGAPVRRVTLPEQCLSYAKSYRAISPEVVMPKDAVERMYRPGESPVPPEYETGPGSVVSTTEVETSPGVDEGPGS